MKLGHIATEYKPLTGGAQTYLANLFDIFANDGWDQTVYQFDNGVVSDELELIPHKPKYVKGGRGVDLWWFNAMLPTKIKSLKRQDALICHYAFHSLPLFWKNNTIVLSHGCEWDIPPTSASQKLKIKIAKWSYKHFKYLVANDTNYFRQMGVIIRPKEHMFEEVSPGKWFIPNCVDTNEFVRTKGRDDIPENSILVARNISYARGVHLSVEAFAIFNRIHPETKLVIVGAFGDDAYQTRVQKLVTDNNLGDKVIFKGSIPWKEMVSVYSSVEMSVVPTLQREGTSLSALEGMSCGTATVSTNVHGLADLPTVQAEPTPNDLAQKMDETYRNRDIVAASQQEIVKNTYNIQNWKNAWLKVLNQIGHDKS